MRCKVILKTLMYNSKSQVMEAISSNSAQTIGEIVTGDLRKARVFRKYGIDFCCGGKKTLEQVCKDKNLDLGTLENDLSNVTGDTSGTVANADQWDADFLADYIVNVHHAYIRHVTPDIYAWAQKVARVHGDRHPEAVEVLKLFTAISDELAGHMIKEENILFPYVKHLHRLKQQGVPAEQSPFGTVKNPIHVMEKEHELVGELFTQMEKVTNHFTPPVDACNTFRALYANLKEFEDDLFLHIHLENNILFPNAIVLEQKLSAD